ncbi:MAG: hypothetical protein E6J90_03005 [Deltaproteobacteria bacterium]|nr:MAG: hypothetical protein E6J90_03005 [Deltaproteobacteria bacterium]
MGRIAAADPRTMAAAVSGNEDAPTVTLDGAATALGTVKDVPAPDGLNLSVACTSPLDCQKLVFDFRQNGQPGQPPMSSVTLTSITYNLPTNARFVLVYKHKVNGADRSVTLFTLNVGVTPSPGPTDTGGGATAGSLYKLATTQCQRIEMAPGPREVFVTPLGTTLTLLPSYFSEADTLTVTVVADVHLIYSLQVRRKSAIRMVTGRILGEDQQLPRLDRQAETAAAKAPCTTRSFTVTNFAPGAGEIEIVASIDANPVTLGSFQLLVDPVYQGMFSIGALWTPLLSPDFNVATRNGQQVIVASETGDRRMAYMFLFTPFVWDGLERDVRRPMLQRKYYEWVNPSVGFVLNDPLNHVLLGATVDLQSALLITGGAIFSHVRELDGVKVGDPFAGAASDLPVQRHWKSDWFLGVSVDVRVGVKLLRAVLGTAGGG